MSEFPHPGEEETLPSDLNDPASQSPEIAEHIPPAVLKMYEVPGHREITRDSLDRYFHDKNTYEAEITELAASNAGNQLSMQSRVSNLPKSERAALIHDILDGDNPVAQLEAIQMIEYVPKSERATLIRQVLAGDNLEAQVMAAEMVRSAPLFQRAALRERVAVLIHQALAGDDLEAQITATEMVYDAPWSARAALRAQVATIVHQALAGDDLEAQVAATRMIEYAPRSERSALKKRTVAIADRVNKTPLAEVLTAPPIYRNHELTSSLSRQSFSKTGSGTTLLGGTLKGAVIIRHIEPEPFLAWQRLYEDYQLWQSKSFDYIPIEPIVGFRPQKNGLVSVASGVLDLSLQQYLDCDWANQRFKNELLADRNWIADILLQMGFHHGHMHKNNFCLRFFRDENGNPDLHRKPRIYLIDFDQAESPAHN